MAQFLSENWLLNRRHVLRGLSVLLSLPLLDCMQPLRAAETTMAHYGNGNVSEVVV